MQPYLRYIVKYSQWYVSIDFEVKFKVIILKLDKIGVKKRLPGASLNSTYMIATCLRYTVPYSVTDPI